MNYINMRMFSIHYVFYIFSDFCVLLLNAWTVLDSSKLVTLISSSLAVILESSSINNRRSLRHTSTIVVPNSNILLLISTILLLWYYILITSYHAQQTLLWLSMLFVYHAVEYILGYNWTLNKHIKRYKLTLYI